MEPSITIPGVTDTADQQVFQLVMQLSRKLMGEYEAQLAQLDLTPPQAQLLRQLGEPLPMVGAAERLHCDPSNITGLVDRLERRGLVERKTVAGDRRVKQLELTDEGRRVKADVERIVETMPGIDALDSSQQDTLRDLLSRSLGRI